MANLLDSGDDKLFQSLLINADKEAGEVSDVLGPPHPLHRVVAPKPGFCVKLRQQNKNDKVFINVCQADNLPEPRDITDEELLALLESEDPSGFRVPMSIGEAHAELDKSGKGCTAYDIIVHPVFLTRMQNSDVMLGFFITIAMQGLEAKYGIELDRNWTILKNRKFLGSLPEQNVRARSQPLIQDMNGDNILGKSSLISEVTPTTEQQQVAEKKAPEPPYTIIQEPPTGHPEFLVAEMHLPKVKSAATVTVDIGEDRILLQTRSNIYQLDVYLPYDVIQEECAAQYNKNTKILTLTMPVVVS